MTTRCSAAKFNGARMTWQCPKPAVAGTDGCKHHNAQAAQYAERDRQLWARRLDELGVEGFRAYYVNNVRAQAWLSESVPS